jgi:cbb3-type cytochrome oxidase subunit 3
MTPKKISRIAICVLGGAAVLWLLYIYVMPLLPYNAFIIIGWAGFFVVIAYSLVYVAVFITWAFSSDNKKEEQYK